MWVLFPAREEERAKKGMENSEPLCFSLKGLDLSLKGSASAEPLAPEILAALAAEAHAAMSAIRRLGRNRAERGCLGSGSLTLRASRFGLKFPKRLNPK